MHPVDAMTPNRPYLIRAIYEWIVDNGLTPYLMVDADKQGVQVPRDYVRDGKIILNVSPAAVKELDIGNDRVLFSGRFGGTPHQVSCPAARR